MGAKNTNATILDILSRGRRTPLATSFYDVAGFGISELTPLSIQLLTSQEDVKELVSLANAIACREEGDRKDVSLKIFTEICRRFVLKAKSVDRANEVVPVIARCSDLIQDKKLIREVLRYYLDGDSNIPLPSALEKIALQLELPPIGKKRSFKKRSKRESDFPLVSFDYMLTRGIKELAQLSAALLESPKNLEDLISLANEIACREEGDRKTASLKIFTEICRRFILNARQEKNSDRVLAVIARCSGLIQDKELIREVLRYYLDCDSNILLPTELQSVKVEVPLSAIHEEFFSGGQVLEQTLKRAKQYYRLLGNQDVVEKIEQLYQERHGKNLVNYQTLADVRTALFASMTQYGIQEQAEFSRNLLKERHDIQELILLANRLACCADGDRKNSSLMIFTEICRRFVLDARQESQRKKIFSIIARCSGLIQDKELVRQALRRYLDSNLKLPMVLGKFDVRVPLSSTIKEFFADDQTAEKTLIHVRQYYQLIGDQYAAKRVQQLVLDVQVHRISSEIAQGSDLSQCEDLVRRSMSYYSDSHIPLPSALEKIASQLESLPIGKKRSFKKQSQRKSDSQLVSFAYMLTQGIKELAQLSAALLESPKNLKDLISLANEIACRAESDRKNASLKIFTEICRRFILNARQEKNSDRVLAVIARCSGLIQDKELIDQVLAYYLDSDLTLPEELEKVDAEVPLYLGIEEFFSDGQTAKQILNRMRQYYRLRGDHRTAGKVELLSHGKKTLEELRPVLIEGDAQVVEAPVMLVQAERPPFNPSYSKESLVSASDSEVEGTPPPKKGVKFKKPSEHRNTWVDLMLQKALQYLEPISVRYWKNPVSGKEKECVDHLREHHNVFVSCRNSAAQPEQHVSLANPIDANMMVPEETLAIKDLESSKKNNSGIIAWIRRKWKLRALKKQRDFLDKVIEKFYPLNANGDLVFKGRLTQKELSDFKLNMMAFRKTYEEIIRESGGRPDRSLSRQIGEALGKVHYSVAATFLLDDEVYRAMSEQLRAQNSAALFKQEWKKLVSEPGKKGDVVLFLDPKTVDDLNKRLDEFSQKFTEAASSFTDNTLYYHFLPEKFWESPEYHFNTTIAGQKEYFSRRKESLRPEKRDEISIPHRTFLEPNTSTSYDQYDVAALMVALCRNNH